MTTPQSSDESDNAVNTRPIPLSTLRVKSKRGKTYGTDPDFTWDKMKWVSDDFMEGLPDCFEFAMGMERGALETEEFSWLNVGPELGSDMLESLADGAWMIVPDDIEQFAKIVNDFYYNTVGGRRVPSRRALLKDPPMIPRAEQYNYRLYYWPHLVEITTEDGTPLECAGHPVTSEVYPGCAIAPLFYFFQYHPNALKDVVAKFGDKSKERLSLSNFVEEYHDLVENFFNIFVVKMPKDFLDQNRTLKRVNPFRRPEPGQDLDDPAILYY